MRTEVESTVVEHNVLHCCFMQGCRESPTWQVNRVTNVNTFTGEKRYGSRCWACDEHKDAVVELRTLHPEVIKVSPEVTKL